MKFARRPTTGAPAGIWSRARTPGSAGASKGSSRWPFRITVISRGGTCSARATWRATASAFATNPAASRAVLRCASATAGVCQKPKSRRDTSTGARDGRAARGPRSPASPMNVWTRSKRRAVIARESDRSRGRSRLNCKLPRAISGGIFVVAKSGTVDSSVAAGASTGASPISG